MDASVLLATGAHTHFSWTLLCQEIEENHPNKTFIIEERNNKAKFFYNSSTMVFVLNINHYIITGYKKGCIPPGTTKKV